MIWSPEDISIVRTVIPTLKMGKIRPGVEEELAQDWTAREQQGWDLNPGLCSCQARVHAQAVAVVGGGVGGRGGGSRVC